MTVAAPIRKVFVSPEEYLKLERAGEEKHEYFNGEIIKMPGASTNNNRITRNLVILLGNALLDDDFEVFSSDQRVRNTLTNTYVYPDVVLVKGEIEYAGDEFDNLTNPLMVAEVLSSSTAAKDRGRKFKAYRKSASFKEYLLVAQNKPFIERFYRHDDGKWEIDDFEDLEGSIRLKSVDVELKLMDVYKKVKFEEDQKVDNIN